MASHSLTHSPCDSEAPEIGSQVEQLEFVPYGHILQDEGNSRRKEKLGTAQIKRPCISHSPGQGGFPEYTSRERLLGSQNEKAPPHSR